MEKEHFINALQSFVTSFEMRLDQRGEGEYALLIPGYRPIRRPAPKRRKLFSRKNKNAVFYEEAATAALSYFFTHFPIGTFYDVGASQGYFAELALNYEAKDIATLAFEARPQPYEKLAEALKPYAQSGRVAEPVLAALSDEHVGAHRIWFSLTKVFDEKPPEAAYRDSWVTRTKYALRGVKGRDSLMEAMVDVTSLDHIAATRDRYPDLIKIDVDGFEAKVLPGTQEIIEAKKPTLFLELHRKKFIERFGVERRDIVRPLFEAGYEALLLDNHHNRKGSILPIEFDNPVIDREETDMLIFYHPDRLAEAGAPA